MPGAHRSIPSRALSDDAPRALVAVRGVARRLIGAALGGGLGLAVAQWVFGRLDVGWGASTSWVTWAPWTLVCLVAWCAALLLGLRLCRGVSRWRPLVFAVFALVAVAAGPGIAAAIEVLPEQSAGIDPFRAWPLLVEAVEDTARPGALPLTLSIGAGVPLGLAGAVLSGWSRAPAWALAALVACGGYLGLAFVCRTSELVAVGPLLGPIRHAAVFGLPGAVVGLALTRPQGGNTWGRRAGWPLALATIGVAVHGHTVHLVHHLLVHDDMVLWAPTRSLRSEVASVRWLGNGTISALRVALTGPYSDRAARALALAGPMARDAVPDLLAQAGAGDARAASAWAAMRVAADDEAVARAVLAHAQRAAPRVREGLAQALYLHDRPVAGRVLLEGLRTDDPSTRHVTVRWLIHWWVMHPEHADDAVALAEGLLRAFASQPTTRADLDLLFSPYRVFRLEALAPHVQAVRDARPDLAATADQVLACMEELGR